MHLLGLGGRDAAGWGGRGATRAAFAVRFPDGRCANGLSLSSAIACSMVAWPRQMPFMASSCC